MLIWYVGSAGCQNGVVIRRRKWLLKIKIRFPKFGNGIRFFVRSRTLPLPLFSVSTVVLHDRRR